MELPPAFKHLTILHANHLHDGNVLDMLLSDGGASENPMKTDKE